MRTQRDKQRTKTGDAKIKADKADIVYKTLEEAGASASSPQVARASAEKCPHMDPARKRMPRRTRLEIAGCAASARDTYLFAFAPRGSLTGVLL